ncbi:hypothetical protein [Actinokineospora iranica]|uniref:Uncharacterized protein n=1 Tax=Actinokineospora iranica TaxID=1271860 RepID=A0A1G6N9Q7_9PSEU|nr:hypothetical protein [Actinokineospora iranica]SDC64441.1 hypothetical protein SAMN05216174_103256 [Actinokineospora iranica]
MEDLWWSDEQAEYIRLRDQRYPGAQNIEPGWTVEAAQDPRRVVRDPDPKSRNRQAMRIIGYSHTAGCVLTVICTRDEHAGVTAWRTSGADLRAYLEGEGQ